MPEIPIQSLNEFIDEPISLKRKL
jgi:hypothetical protein